MRTLVEASILAAISLLASCSIGGTKPVRSGAFQLTKTVSPVSHRYVMFFYQLEGANISRNYHFVVLPATTPAPADANAIDDYRGSITPRVSPDERAGMIFLEGNVRLNDKGLPESSLTPNTSNYKLYAAAADGSGEVVPLTVATSDGCPGDEVDSPPGESPGMELR